MATNPYATAAARDLQQQEDWNAQLSRMQGQGSYAQQMQGAGYQYNPNQQGSTNVPIFQPDANPTKVTLGGNQVRAGDNFDAYPNAWWGHRANDTRPGGAGIPQISLAEFSNNPEAVARLWTQRHGFGEGTRHAIGQFSDPRAVMYGANMMMGPALSDIPSQLDQTGQLFANLLGVHGGPSGYFDPRQIVNKIVNLRKQYDSTGAETGQLDPFAAAMLDADPTVQVTNTIRFLGSALQGIMPRDSFEAYMRLLQREGESFMLWRMQNPQLSGTFNKWVGDRLGPTGGL